jgi:superfamily II DNA/RNA helicase
VFLSSGGGASGEFAAVGSGGEATSVEEKEKQRKKKEKKKKEKEEKKKEKEEKEKHKRDKKEEKEREKREREKEREEKEKAKRERKEEKEREKKERKSGLKSTSEPVLPPVLQHSSPQHGGPQAVPLMGSLPSTPVSSNQPQQASPTSPTSPSTQRRDRRNTDLFGVWRRSLAGKRDRSDATSTLHQQTHSQPEERRGSTPPRPSAAAFQAPPLAHSASVQSMPAVRRVAISAGAEKRLSKESPDVLQQTELRKYNAMRELGAESMQYIEKRRSMEVGSYGSLGRKTGLDAINEFNSVDPLRKYCTSLTSSFHYLNS